LKKIQPNTFNGLTRLERLSLEDNHIEEINGNLLVDLRSHKELWIFSNKLTQIDRSCFEPLKSIAAAIGVGPFPSSFFIRAWDRHRQTKKGFFIAKI